MNLNRILYLSLIAVFLILITNCSSDKNIEDLNKNAEPYKKTVISQEAKELLKMKKNRVSSRMIYSKFTTKYVKSGAREVLVERINLDEKGQKTEQFRYISNGDIDLQWLYDYNYYGQPTMIETYDGYQKLIFKEIKSHNSDGYLDKTETWTDKTKGYAITEYEYDSNYNLIKEIYRNTKSEIVETKEYAYNNSIRDSLLLLNNSKELVYSITFEYNSDTTLVMEKQVDRFGKQYTTEFKYDQNGNITNIENSVLSDWIFEYDANGNIILEVENNSDGFLQSKFTYKYDEDNDLLIEKIRYDGEDDPAVIIRFEYEYY